MEVNSYMEEQESRKLGPCSQTQQDFLQNTSKFCIYGGGKLSASTLKTLI